MKARLLILILMLFAATANAETGQDLQQATNTFEAVKASLSDKVNKLPQDLRTEIWSQYYLALEHLDKMDVHYRMISEHGLDRQKEFDRSHVKFNAAMEALKAALPAELM